MDPFLERYQTLIDEINTTADVNLREPYSIFVRVVATDALFAIIWESEESEIFSFRLQLPGHVLAKGLRLAWTLVVRFSSPSNRAILIKRITLFSTGTKPKGGLKLLPYVKNLRKSFLVNYELGSKPAFNGDNSLSKYLIHAARLLASRSRREYDATHLRKKRRTLRTPPDPDGTQNLTYNTNFIQSYNESIVIDNNNPLAVLRKSRTSARQSTPNFFLLKKWERPINPYSMQETVVSSRFGYQRVLGVGASNPWRYSWIGPTEFFVPYSAPTLNFGPEADLEAYKSLLKKLNGAVARETSPGVYKFNDGGLGRDFNQAPTNIVQFRQAVRMISRNAKKLLGAYKAVKRLDFIKAQNILFESRGVKPRFRRGGYLHASKSVANNWLELQYGWKPFLSDIKGVIDSLHRDYHPHIRSVRGVGHHNSTVETNISGPFHGTFNSVSPYTVGTQVKVTSETVHYGLRYRVSDSDRVVLAQTGFTNPISLLWELLPFSFVADWFYPIGPYLESLASFDGLVFVDGFKTQFIREQTGVILNSDSIKGGPTYYWDIKIRGGLQATSVKVVRTRLETFPSHPRILFKNPLSVAHAQNAIALLVANFVKK